MAEFSQHKEIIDGWFARQGNADIKGVRLKNILQNLIEIDNKYSITQNIAESNELLSNSIEKLKLTNNETSAKICEMEQFITENKALLNRQAELNSKFETLQTTKKTIEDLKIKKSEVEKPENSIEDLNDEILKINGKINNKLNDYTIQLKALNDILVESSSSLEQEASEIINQSISNIDAISNKQYSIIEKLSNEPVKTIYETFDERIANLTSEYNVYVEKIESIKNDLELIENKHSSIVVSFKLHELENERVFGNLRKIGEMDGVNVYVETLIREIKDKLSDFDNNIKKLIDKKKELPLFERI
jgi:prefoldin subunit 5